MVQHLAGDLHLWTIGGNATALEAGEAGELPSWFAKSNKNHAPVGPAVLLVIGVIGFVLPTEDSNPVTYVATIVIGIVASQIVGEILMSVAAKKNSGAKED